MNIDNLIPGLGPVKAALYGVAALATLGAGIYVYNWWQSYCGPQCQVEHAAFELQKKEFGELQIRFNGVIEDNKNLAADAARYKALAEDNQKRAAAEEKKRKAYAAQIDKLKESLHGQEDGPLAAGVLFGLDGLCRTIRENGGVCAGSGSPARDVHPADDRIKSDVRTGGGPLTDHPIVGRAEGEDARPTRIDGAGPGIGEGPRRLRIQAEGDVGRSRCRDGQGRSGECCERGKRPGDDLPPKGHIPISWRVAL